MLERLFDVISVFFDSTWGFLAFLAIAVIIVFSFSKHRKVFLITLVLAVLLSAGLKEVFSHERPCVETGSLPCPAPYAGFPSNHALVATVIVLGALGTAWFWPFLFFAIAISLSRIWLGVHSFDQVSGGIALGAIVFLAVFELNQKIYGEYISGFDLDELLDDNLLNKRVA
ncbi:MAG: phosphatase PAP2 family protein [Candidatus Micrarchaeota archaeon]